MVVANYSYGDRTYYWQQRLIAIVTQRQLATMQLTETVRQLILISQSQPTVRKIALELLKQGEGTRNRVIIDKLL